MTARDLDIDATGDDGRMINNSDGFDVDGSKNVLIENCTFCQGDDALVFKSGKDFDGRRRAVPTENVVVRNCMVRKGHNLAAVGWYLDVSSAAGSRTYFTPEIFWPFRPKSVFGCSAARGDAVCGKICAWTD